LGALPTLPNNQYLPKLDEILAAFANFQPYGNLPPELAALLETQKSSALAGFNAERADTLGSLVTDLWGRGVERSSISEEAASRTSLQEAAARGGLENDAAMRELMLRGGISGQLLQALGGQAGVAGQEAGISGNTDMARYQAAIQAVMSQFGADVGGANAQFNVNSQYGLLPYESAIQAAMAQYGAATSGSLAGYGAQLQSGQSAQDWLRSMVSQQYGAQTSGSLAGYGAQLQNDQSVQDWIRNFISQILGGGMGGTNFGNAFTGTGGSNTGSTSSGIGGPPPAPSSNIDIQSLIKQFIANLLRQYGGMNFSGNQTSFL